MKKKVLLRGPILTRSGYGEQARFAYRALKSQPDKFDVFVVPTGQGKTGWIVDDSPEREELDKNIISTSEHIKHCNTVGTNPFDIAIQVTIPQEWEKLASVNIGFTAGTETTHISLPWMQKANEIDRIIAVSEHTKSGFVNTVYTGQNEFGQEVQVNCTTPVDVVNFPAKTETSPTPIELDVDTEFNFLSVVQWGPRKNLENTILGFIEEFRDDENVGLVVKANFMRNSLVDRNLCETRLKKLKESAGEHKCKIYLLHGNMTDEEMLGLYTNKNIHAFINIAHGEGFGLPIFEAAYSGLPIIAPNWGGQKDFLNARVTRTSKLRSGKKKSKTKHKFLATDVEYRIAPIQKEAVWENVLIEQSMWCYPVATSYRKAMRTVFKNYDRAIGKSKTLKEIITTEFSERKQNEKFVNSVLEAAAISGNVATPGLTDQVVTL